MTDLVVVTDVRQGGVKVALRYFVGTLRQELEWKGGTANGEMAYPVDNTNANEDEAKDKEAEDKSRGKECPHRDCNDHGPICFVDGVIEHQRHLAINLHVGHAFLTITDLTADMVVNGVSRGNGVVKEIVAMDALLFLMQDILARGIDNKGVVHNIFGIPRADVEPPRVVTHVLDFACLFLHPLPGNVGTHDAYYTAFMVADGLDIGNDHLLGSGIVEIGPHKRTVGGLLTFLIPLRREVVVMRRAYLKEYRKLVSTVDDIRLEPVPPMGVVVGLKGGTVSQENRIQLHLFFQGSHDRLGGV